MTRETLAFLLNLLDAQQISVGAPDFEEAVTRVVQARRELIVALEAPPESPSPL